MGLKGGRSVGAFRLALEADWHPRWLQVSFWPRVLRVSGRTALAFNFKLTQASQARLIMIGRHRSFLVTFTGKLRIQVERDPRLKRASRCQWTRTRRAVRPVPVVTLPVASVLV